MNTLDSHRSYYNQLHRHYLAELKIIDENRKKMLATEKDRKKIKDIEEKAENEKKSLEKKFNETTDIICKVYDK